MPSALLQVCEMAVQNDDTIEGRRGDLLVKGLVKVQNTNSPW